MKISVFMEIPFIKSYLIRMLIKINQQKIPQLLFNKIKESFLLNKVVNLFEN